MLIEHRYTVENDAFLKEANTYLIYVGKATLKFAPFCAIVLYA